MAKGIQAHIKAMVMSVETKEFSKDSGEVIQYIKLQIHDKQSKQTLECKYDGEVEDFLKLGIEEYESYNVTLEFSSYKVGGRSNISCKVTNIDK